MRAAMSSKRSEQIDGVGDEAVHLAHVHRFVHGRGGGSGCRRDAGRRGRWRPAADCRAPPIRRPPPAGLPCRAARKRGMFMCSGQLFSQGESARSSQTPARQRWARMWSSNSWRKCRMVVSTRIGRRLAQAAQRGVADHAAQFVQACRDPLRVPCPRVNAFRMRSALSSPTRQGTHLPQDSEWVNSMK